MKYYVYRILNLTNGKWYIGKRKHNSPYEDHYMGSGKLIKAAISKYGRDNFLKEIISVFNTNDEAALLEASLVTRESISTGMSYNMHEGGHGGFAHINDGSAAHIERAKRASSLVKNRYNLSSDPKSDNFKFNTEKSLHANDLKKINMMENPEKYKEVYKKISDYQKKNNSMKDKCWCVPIDSTNYEYRKVFPTNEIPSDWVAINSVRDSRKRKTSTYGKFWIHNTTTKENKYCSGLIPEGWTKGRKIEYYQRSVD